ncbi:hypothetical protein ACSQ67_010598 [Phaseolus vulgaris]
MCYVGKATKIFIFIVTVLLVLGLVLGLGLLRRRHHTNTANDCSDGSCFHPSPSLPDPNFNSPTPPSSIQYPPTPPTIPVTNPTAPVTNPTPPPPSDTNPSSPPPPMLQSPPPPPPPEETAPPNPPSVAAPPINTPTPGSALVAQGPLKHLRLWIFESKDPSHKALMLGLAAAVLLTSAHVIVNLVCGFSCLCSQQEDDKASPSRQFSMASLILTWQHELHGAIKKRNYGTDAEIYFRCKNQSGFIEAFRPRFGIDTASNMNLSSSSSIDQACILIEADDSKSASLLECFGSKQLIFSVIELIQQLQFESKHWFIYFRWLD